MRIYNLKQSLVYLITIIIFITTSCTNDNDKCSNISCTEDFRSVLVSIKGSDGKAISLDSFEVINIDDQINITIKLSQIELKAAQERGEYPIANDLSISENQDKNIIFKGFINNKEVVKSTYLISKDCCHIKLTSGNASLTI